MMRHRVLTAGIVSVATVAVVMSYFVGRARAGGIPMANAMTFGGVLTDGAGVPLSGSKNLQVLLWDMATGGTTPACSTTSVSIALVGGAFQVQLPDPCAAAVHAKPDLWAEVLVDGGSIGRVKLGVVPYALESSHAVSADSASAAGGALATTIFSLTSRVTALESAKPFTAVDRFPVPSSTTYYADCTSQTGIFVPGACPRMAWNGCVAAGYRGGWFEGDLAGSDPYVACIK